MKRRHPSNRVRKSSLQRRRCALERLEDRHLLAVLFADSFESGGGAGDWAGNWVEDGQNDWFRSTQRATNGTYSAEVDGLAKNATLRLATPVDLTGYASAQLTFDWLIESGFDGGEYLALDVSSDGGSSWQTDVRRLSGNVDAENAWHSETVELDPSANVLIRFRSLVDRSSEDANVDNVQIVGSTASTLPWTQQAALTGVSQTGDLAGGIVAISGDTIAVTSALNDEQGLDAGAAYVYVRDDAGTPNDPSDDTWSQQASLIGSDTVAGDQFARSIDIQGDTIVVGAYQLDNGGNGAAYVFSRTGSTWSEVAKLTASDGASSDRFGGRVAIDGDTIVIGAQADNTVGSGSDAGTGAAYVFAEPVGGWSGNLTENSKLTASNAAPYDRFGRNVDVLGDTVMVGADQRDSGGGAAYAFYRDDAGTPLNPSDDFWSESAILEASDGATGDQFGNVVALDGNRAIITAHRDDHSGQVDAGSAYIFERSENGTPLDLTDDVWVEVAKLQASDASGDDQFGRGADIEGDIAVVGATNGEMNVADSGSVYFFERQSDGTWIEQGEIDRNDAQSSGSFGGEKIDLEGGTLVVGDTSYGAGAGGAFVFVRSNLSPSNLSPIVDAGDQVTVVDSDDDGSETVTVVGSGSDPDGSIVSYEWTDGTNVLGNTASISPTLPVGTNVLTLTVTDNDGATASDTVTVTIEAPAAAISLYVQAIDFDLRKGGKEARAVFQIYGDTNLSGDADAGDSPVAGVTIKVWFAGQLISGTTDSNGFFRTQWFAFGNGTHYANVDSLMKTGYSIWTPLDLDVENDTDGDGYPDDFFIR